MFLLSVCQQGFFLYLPPSRSLPGLSFFCLSVSRVSSSTCLHQGAYLACASVCLSAGFLPLLASIKELTWLVLLSVCQQGFFFYLPPSRSLPGLCFCLSVSRVSIKKILQQISIMLEGNQGPMKNDFGVDLTFLDMQLLPVILSMQPWERTKKQNSE